MKDASSKEMLLNSIDEEEGETKGHNGTQRLEQQEQCREPLRKFFFKCYVVAFTIFVWTGYTLLVAYTRQMTPKSKLYSSSTVVFLSECVKLAITVCFVYAGCGFSIRKGNQLLNKEFIAKPFELAKMSVPSMAYALQNNLDFIALSNLDASVYQVITQLKIPSTAVFMMVFLNRHFSMRRWIAIFLLCAGVALVQLDISEEHDEASTNGEKVQQQKGNKLTGLIAVLATCVTAGFAGVYFEKMLKDGSTTPFWIRNLQMYSCGVISDLLGCYLKDFEKIQENGFTFGYNTRVWFIVVFLSLGGIYISLIMKHLDNLYKSFASSLSIICVVLISLLIFEHFHVTALFVLGASVVCFSVIFYNSVDH